MTTRVGTVQVPKIGRSIWLAAILAALVVLTLATVALSIGRDEGAPIAPAAGISSETSGGVSETFPGSTSVNTPSELSGGVVGGRVYETAANTPTELSGGLTAAERYDLSQRI